MSGWLDRVKQAVAWAIGVLFLSVLLARVALAGDFPAELHITYVKQPFNLQNMLLKNQSRLEEAFKAKGTKVVWHTISAGTQQLQGLAAGSLDVTAAMNTTTLLLARSQGVAIKAIAGVAHPSDLFALVSQAPLTPSTLKRMVFAGPKGTIMHQLLWKVLRDAGLTLNDVTLLTMDPTHALASLQTGRTQGALLVGHLVTTAQEAGFKHTVSATGRLDPTLVMVARDAFLTTYPEAAQLLRQIARETYDWMMSHPEEAMTIGAKEQGISLEEARRLFTGSHFFFDLTERETRALRDDALFLRETGLVPASAIEPTLSDVFAQP